MHRNFCEVKCRYLEHVSCTFRIGLSDERCVKIYETFALEERVDSESHGVPYSQDCSESIGPQSHVGYCPEIFQRSVFLLERVSHRVALAVDFDAFSLDFHVLSASEGLYQLSSYTETCTRGDFLHQVLIEEFSLGYNLDIIDRRTVVKCYEFYLFVSSLGPYPTFGKYLLTWLHFQQILDFRPYNFFHCYDEFRYFSKDN